MKSRLLKYWKESLFTVILSLVMLVLLLYIQDMKFIVRACLAPLYAFWAYWGILFVFDIASLVINEPFMLCSNKVKKILKDENK